MYDDYLHTWKVCYSACCAGSDSPSKGPSSTALSLYCMTKSEIAAMTFGQDGVREEGGEGEFDDALESLPPEDASSYSLLDRAIQHSDENT